MVDFSHMPKATVINTKTEGDREKCLFIVLKFLSGQIVEHGAKLDWEEFLG